MTKMKSALATKFWDWYGYFYDGLVNLYPYQNLIKKVASKITLNSDTKLLDLGCGTGNLALELLKTDAGLSLTAVDWSSSMLRQADKKLNRYKNVKLEQSRVEDFLIQTTDSQYTDVVLVNVVYTIQDRKLLWSQIFKKLKPEGNLIFANPDRPGNASILKEHIENSSWLSLIRPRLIGIWVFDTVISLLGVSGSYQFASKEQLYAELEIAGFEVHEKLTERCYGGSDAGIDIIVIASKPGAMV